MSLSSVVEIGRGNIGITEITQSCSNITSICHNLFTKMAATQQLQLKGEHLLEEPLANYKVHNIFKCKLQNQIGKYMEGISRSFFSSFWQRFRIKCMYSSNYYVFYLCPGKPLVQPEPVGRILVHGLILTGCLPIFMNKALVFAFFRSQLPVMKLFWNVFQKQSVLQRDSYKKKLDSAIYETEISRAVVFKVTDLFNSFSDNKQILPKVNTCSSSIIISRFFCRYDLVERFFENSLSNENVWDKFDSI